MAALAAFSTGVYFLPSCSRPRTLSPESIANMEQRSSSASPCSLAFSFCRETETVSEIKRRQERVRTREGFRMWASVQQSKTPWLLCKPRSLLGACQAAWPNPVRPRRPQDYRLACSASHKKYDKMICISPIHLQTAQQHTSIPQVQDSLSLSSLSNPFGPVLSRDSKISKICSLCFFVFLNLSGLIYISKRAFFLFY